MTKAPYKGVAGCGQGQPAREADTAAGVAPAGTVDYGQPAGAAAARGHTRLQHRARKGGWPQGARKGLPPAANPIATRGDGAGRRGGLPLARWLPTDKGSHHLRRWGKRGRASF
ncbi:hypothetical protein BHE74_00057838 [Ensete ventricosum]|nr:hypothetical protein BHE74_00057838 [Ensete ventricosum]